MAKAWFSTVLLKAFVSRLGFDVWTSPRSPWRAGWGRGALGARDGHLGFFLRVSSASRIAVSPAILALRSAPMVRPLAMGAMPPAGYTPHSHSAPRPAPLRRRVFTSSSGSTLSLMPGTMAPLSAASTEANSNGPTTELQTGPAPTGRCCRSPWRAWRGAILHPPGPSPRPPVRPRCRRARHRSPRP